MATKAMRLVSRRMVSSPFQAQHARRAVYAWRHVLRSFGSSGHAKVHARTLFSGDARRNTEWAHLDESRAAKLAISLMESIRRENAFFSIGVVHTSSYPREGIPDGLDRDGRQVYQPISCTTFYCFAFLAAAAGLQSNVGILQAGMPYELFLDPLPGKVKLFHDWNSAQAARFVRASGLTPTTFLAKPMLLDAADLFAYAAARALSQRPARNKDCCRAIYKITAGAQTDWRWTP